ncbi:hypothetical protein Z962_05830 [Clostridium botulinum C/D str. BKT12695]|nr:hypothetical protein Z962_05830 [Clostridium botulinum C/D str. BKT12695]
MYEIKKEIGKRVQKEVNKKVIKEVNKKVPQQVAKRVGEETERVKLMIDNLKKDENLMCETKMIVISYNDEEEEEAKSLLKQFKKTQFMKFNYALHNINELCRYDVIFFNDINGYIEEKDMKKIVYDNTNNQAVYFYFNKRNIRFQENNIKNGQNNAIKGQGIKTFNCEGNENINFAKSNATLCGNLLDLMRYQEDILKN